MFRRSVLNQSGQLWKFFLALLALLVGSFAPLLPASGISWTVGAVIAVIGYTFGLVAIRCVQCDSKWFWEAAKDAAWYGPLFTGSICPKCKHSFATDGSVDL